MRINRVTFSTFSYEYTTLERSYFEARPRDARPTAMLRNALSNR